MLLKYVILTSELILIDVTVPYLMEPSAPWKKIRVPSYVKSELRRNCGLELLTGNVLFMLEISVVNWEDFQS